MAALRFIPAFVCVGVFGQHAAAASKIANGWSFGFPGGPGMRIADLEPDAAGELFVLTKDRLGPYGSTGKVLKPVP